MILQRIVTRIKNLHRPTGYVFVPEAESGPFSGAQSGSLVSVPRRTPPWIVVDHSLESVPVHKWPGRLWRVRVTEPVTKDDTLRANAGTQSPSANYTRAITVQVIEELPTARLFGRYGSNVCCLLDIVSRLTGPEFARLAEKRDPAAAAAYSRAWTVWLQSVTSQHSLSNSDLSGTLSISPRPGSPLNHGFSLLYSELSKRARILGGPSVFTQDQDGELSLVPPWSTAGSALLETAVAVGAPHLSSKEDLSILLHAWRSVFGNETCQ